MEAIQTIALTHPARKRKVPDYLVKETIGLTFNVGKYLAAEGINPEVLPTQE